MLDNRVNVMPLGKKLGNMLENRVNLLPSYKFEVQYVR
jgi:hypothetical protein